MQFHGESAIIPHLSGIPTFGEDDVKAYVKRFGYSRGRREIIRGNLCITRISFISTKELKDIMRWPSTQENDGDLVCFVMIDGDFTFVLPPPNAPRHFHRAYQIFDAQSGNLLSHGEFPDH